MPIAGIDLIKSQLVFADGFRPDLIVARDPFESALVALWAAKKYRRGSQLHVLVNYFHPSFTGLASPNRWRKLIARYTVPQFFSIRVASDRILNKLKEKTSVIDIDRLPQLNPYEAVSQTAQTLDLKQQYPQYVFTILFVGSLDDSTAALKAIDAARYMLRNPKICLIIMGEGKERGECERRVKTLGISEQVIFEYRSPNVVQYLLAADLLIVTNVDDPSEETVLQAAGAGIPMVLVRTERRDDAFVHRESAYMCDPDDSQAQSDGVHELMNNYQLRNQLAEQARAVIEDTFHQDPKAYLHDYQTSIESAMFAEEVASELVAEAEAKTAAAKAAEADVEE
jgi:glycosyltransferase involved in cell wall biosynthesis